MLWDLPKAETYVKLLAILAKGVFLDESYYGDV